MSGTLQRAQLREQVVHTLLGARSIRVRLAAVPDLVLFADVVKCDRIEEVVVLKPWGWRRRLLGVRWEEVAVAVPSVCPHARHQQQIETAQRPLEGDPLWPPR